MRGLRLTRLKFQGFDLSGNCREQPSRPLVLDGSG